MQRKAARRLNFPSAGIPRLQGQSTSLGPAASPTLPIVIASGLELNPFSALGAGVICQAWAARAAVIPAKAGIYSSNLWQCAVGDGIPAFAGMTRVSRGVPFQTTPAATA